MRSPLGIFGRIRYIRGVNLLQVRARNDRVYAVVRDAEEVVALANTEEHLLKQTLPGARPRVAARKVGEVLAHRLRGVGLSTVHYEGSICLIGAELPIYRELILGLHLEKVRVTVDGACWKRLNRTGLHRYIDSTLQDLMRHGIVCNVTPVDPAARSRR